MQAIAKVAVFGLGVLASSTALPNDGFGGPPIYNAQYAHNASPHYYGGYPTSYPNYTGYPYYYGSNYPGIWVVSGDASLRLGSNGAWAPLYSFKSPLGSLRRMALGLRPPGDRITAE
jgi:hypothetical protein